VIAAEVADPIVTGFITAIVMGLVATGGALVKTAVTLARVDQRLDAVDDRLKAVEAHHHE
jgi:hypothetical protein